MPLMEDNEVECAECHHVVDKESAISFGPDEYICYACAQAIDEESRPRLEEVKI